MKQLQHGPYEGMVLHWLLCDIFDHLRSIMRSCAMGVQSIPRPEILATMMSGFMHIKRMPGPVKWNIIYDTLIYVLS